MATMLDPHPTNELGKGILDPEREALLLSRGMVYARRVTFVNERGRTCSYIRCSRRPIDQALAEAVQALAKKRLHQPVNGGGVSVHKVIA